MKWFSVDIEPKGTRYDPLSLKGSMSDILYQGIRAYGVKGLMECHQLAVL